MADFVGKYTLRVETGITAGEFAGKVAEYIATAIRATGGGDG